MHINIMKAVGTTAENKIIAAKEDAVSNVEEIGESSVVAM